MVGTIFLNAQAPKQKKRDRRFRDLGQHPRRKR
jgi:hypothetical protein